MTIIAGFKSSQGVVICADTQETIEHSKRNVTKLIFEPANHDNGSTDDLAAAFCGAGDGPFVDKLIANAWESGQSATSLDEVCAEIESSIKETYREFGTIYQPGYCPVAELIYGVKMYNATKLFTADGPIVNESDGYSSSGIGYYIADFLAGRMYDNCLSLRNCAILAAYILFQTKEHVEGCGGDSHIAVLRNEGVSGRISSERIETITKILKHADNELGTLLLTFGDFDKMGDEIKRLGAFALDVLTMFREQHITDMKESEEMWYKIFETTPEQKDSLGLPRTPKPK
jgi:20S proteasome alpha/beta subunit